jgi:hypothetical protein
MMLFNFVEEDRSGRIGYIFRLLFSSGEKSSCMRKKEGGFNCPRP